MNTNRQAVLLLLSLLGLLVGGEYLLLGYPERLPLRWLRAGIRFYARLGWCFRLLLPLLATLLFALPAEADSYRSQRHQPRVTGGGRLGLLLALGLTSVLLTLAPHQPAFYARGLPGLVGVSLLVGALTGRWVLRQPPPHPLGGHSGGRVPAWGFRFRLRGGGWITIPNPFRGILVVGGPGAGKSESLAKPLIRQGFEQDYCGILYDIKFPELTRYAYHCHRQRPGVSSRLCVLNFEDMDRTHRLNPIAPEHVPSLAYAEEFALALLRNLQPETISRPDFWSRSSTALLTGVLWYLRKNQPDCCTLPHVVTLLTKMPYDRLMGLLRQDSETLSYVMSLLTAMDNRSGDQLSGVMGTLQVLLAKLATPEIFWVMSATDEGFSMDLNRPQQPLYLCLGGSRTLVESLRPILGLYCTVALKQMNQPGKHPSLLLLDEAPTVYIPHFDQIPATGRSSRIATVFMCQDLAQIRKYYGERESQLILGTLGNQLYGSVSHAETARYVSQLIGQHEVVRPERSQDEPSALDLGALLSPPRAGGRTAGPRRSVSYRRHERPIVYPEDLPGFRPGEFVGFCAEAQKRRFWGTLVRERDSPDPPGPLPAFGVQHDLRLNRQRIMLDCARLLQLDAAQTRALLD